MVANLGALDSLRTMMGVIREVSLDEIREQIDTPPRLLVIGPTSEEARKLAIAVAGAEGQFSTLTRAVDEPIESTGRVDAAIVWDPERTGAGSRVAEALRFESPPVPVVRFEGTSSDAEPEIEQLRADILKRIGERAASFGRALPAFRAAAAKQVISETSVANAQFSLVSNIPTLLPVIGNLAAAGADFIVLTKNQVMMLYKLAAIHGRDLNDRRSILQEVLPVVGAGLVWRTVAREAATMMPFASGAVPKLAIAYGGTMAVGRAADFYYRTGMKPSSMQLEQFGAEALERVRNLDLPLVRKVLPKRDNGSTRAEPTFTVLNNEDLDESR
jgi:uncharacterized protein (DUF697 family)